MNFLILFGPPAVGKMTVGYELETLTGMKLFHNHMTIELVLNFFNRDDPEFNTLNEEFRRRIFEEIASSDLHGLIFTFVWAFNEPSEKLYVDKITDIFKNTGAEIFYVELEADLDERLIRYRSAFRLQHKPSKRDTELSEQILLQHDEGYEFNSSGNFYYQDNYLRIDNTNMEPVEVAVMIDQTFTLKQKNP